MDTLVGPVTDQIAHRIADLVEECQRTFHIYHFPPEDEVDAFYRELLVETKDKIKSVEFFLEWFDARDIWEPESKARALFLGCMILGNY